jgi:MFS family permease
MPASPTGSAQAAEIVRTSAQSRTLTLASAATLLVLATFVTPLGTLSRTAASLGTSPEAQPWLLSAMSLGLAVALLPTGALGDGRGRRAVFSAGLAAVAVGAAVCALAESTGAFVTGRVLEGLGGAAVLSCSLGMIGASFPPGPTRLNATGVWGASIGAGIALGGVISAAVDRGEGWRATYALTAAVALALAALARYALTESRAASARRPDVLGAVLLAAGLACLIGALVEGGRQWDTREPVALLSAAVLLLGAFVGAEAIRREPMLELSLFRRRSFIAATVAALANGAALISVPSFIPTLVQKGLGGSLAQSSFLVLVLAGTSVVTALNVKRLPQGLTGPALLAGGLVAAALSLLTLGWVPDHASPYQLLPGAVLSGAAFGVINAALGREAVASVPPDQVGMGSGANNTARYVGAAIGTSVVAIIATNGGASPAGDGLVDGWNNAVLYASAVCGIAAAVVVACRGQAAGHGPDIGQPQTPPRPRAPSRR